MGIYSEILFEESKKKKMNISQDSLIEVDNKVESVLRKIREENPENLKLVKDVSDLIIHKLSDNFSDFIEKDGKINIERVAKTITSIAQEESTKTKLEENIRQEVAEIDKKENRTNEEHTNEKKESKYWEYFPENEDLRIADENARAVFNSMTEKEKEEFLKSTTGILEDDGLSSISSGYDFENPPANGKTEIELRAKIRNGTATLEDIKELINILEEADKNNDISEQRKLYLKMLKENENDPLKVREQVFETIPGELNIFILQTVEQCKSPEEFFELTKDIEIFMDRFFSKNSELEGLSNEKKFYKLQSLMAKQNIESFKKSYKYFDSPERFAKYIKDKKIKLPEGYTVDSFFEEIKSGEFDERYFDTLIDKIETATDIIIYSSDNKEIDNAKKVMDLCKTPQFLNGITKINNISLYKVENNKTEDIFLENKIGDFKIDIDFGKFDYGEFFTQAEEELGLNEIDKTTDDKKQQKFESVISGIFPREETEKKGIDMTSIALEDFGEMMDAFATGNKQYILSVMLNQNMEAMQYLVKNLKHTVELGDFLEQHKFVPKEVTDRWKQMAAEGKDPFEEMRKEATKELNLEEPEVAKVEKKISGVTSVKEVMAVPKEVVLDYMEMDIKVGTDPKNATMIMAEQLKQSKVLTKFKGMKESGLSVEEYSEIMAGVIMETEQMMDDGRLPKTIVEKGQERNAGLSDFINMTFDNTEILLSNMPEKASELGKEELAKLIKEKVEEATRETEAPEVEEQENEVENLHTHENIEVEQLEEERDVNREAEREAQKAIEQKELEKRLQKEQAKELEVQERSLTDDDAKTLEEQKKLVEEQEKQQQALVPVQKGFMTNVRKIFNDVRMNVSKFFENIKDKIAGNDKQNKEEEKKEIKPEESKVDKETKEDDYFQKVNVNPKELSAQKVTVKIVDEQDRGDER